MIAQEAAPDANIIWGAAFDPSLEDKMKVTIIATGFAKKEEQALAAKTEAPKEEPVAEEPKAAPVQAPVEDASQDPDYEEILDILKKPRPTGNTSQFTKRY